MLDQNGRFVINDFQRQKPFSSLLPGIAGSMGIPMWAFYTNRGQAISCFGVEDKNHAFMEFQSANKAYQMTPLTGFRTFIKTLATGQEIYEPFSPWQAASGIRRDMFIGMNEVEIQETNPARGMQVNVLYFTLPGEPMAALIRQVTICNTGREKCDLEILDGMPAAIPYGIENRMMKEMSRTAEAWMEVFNLASGIPFYRVDASIGDSAEVKVIEKGFFAASTISGQLLPALVDPGLVFDQDTSLFAPEGFRRQTVSDLHQQPQVTRGKTPCAFFGAAASLAPGETLTLVSAFGLVNALEDLNAIRARFQQPGYFDEKIREARDLATSLTEPATCRTSSSLFDAYTRQSFLDNVLRGGWPVLLGSQANPVVYHLYSRKHGDLERDYNAFFLAAEHYSQGNGNFRDVVQNRRTDVFFNPQIGDFNIRMFLSLIQPDGYNPLVVKGSRFILPIENQASLLPLVERPEALKAVLSRAFTPGELLEVVTRPQTGLKEPPQDFLNRVLGCARQQLEADFGEGYWSDHWSYLLDLIENYLSIYPDRKSDLLFGAANIPYYDSPYIVKPRSQKYLRVDGKIRQYEAVEKDIQKSALISSRATLPNWVRSSHGRGEICQATVFEKLAGLALIKFATLDPAGIGVEMEADKPAWCDALNGLPGLFGSSVSDTIELARLLAFLIQALTENRSTKVFLHTEIVDLFQRVDHALRERQASTSAMRDFLYWDTVSTCREEYREKIKLGFDGVETEVPGEKLAAIFQAFLARLSEGIAAAERLCAGMLPTYLTYTVTSYAELYGEDGMPRTDEQGRIFVRALRFDPHPLPIFLEGFAHALKIQPDRAAARRLHQLVNSSELYDRPLKMYRTCVSLASESHEIGRIRAFPPGWLENESIFLHMEYKYLLELLKTGLLDEYFESIRSALIPFLEPARYGRSPLENVSFLASSAYPDPSLRGSGFVARLTGATAEFLSMWTVMMAGSQPFQVRDGELCLALAPALPGWFFPQDGRLSFRFLGTCTVTLHNPLRLDTYSGQLQMAKTVIVYQDGSQAEFTGGVIKAPHAAEVRSGRARSIDIYFEKVEGK